LGATLVKSKLLASFAALGMFYQLGMAHAATVVALGASNTAGKGVSPGEAYPAQLCVRAALMSPSSMPA
jgi:acyl-CoA thioesterase I